jgi:hypothetical protein
MVGKVREPAKLKKVSKKDSGRSHNVAAIKTVQLGWIT